MSKPKTLVLGATTNADRYAFLAANRLHNAGHAIELVGIKPGDVAQHPIQTGKPALENIDTVTLYVGPKNQPEWYDYVVKLNPRRVIFNPGTENADFQTLLASHKIEAIEACTLVMLSTKTY